MTNVETAGKANAYSNEEGENKANIKVDPVDGTIYEWSEKNRAWFPKVDEDFILKHNVEYGFSEDLKPIESQVDPESLVVSKPAKKKKPAVEENKNETEWFQVDQAHDTHAYVSGLPPDVTEDEFIEIMSKYGIIMEDPETKKLKIKLYKDSEGNNKGDGLCCYLRNESVVLAIDILDESELRDHTIHVDYASFQIKGEFDPKLKAKKRKKKSTINQEKLLDWTERDQHKKAANRRACVIQYLFDPKEFVNDPAGIIDYKSELADECSKFGEVKKVFVFERSENGVASILFKDEDSAQRCIKKMDGRLCDGRVLCAHIWDGVTKYQTEETEEEKEERLIRWHQSLEE